MKPRVVGFLITIKCNAACDHCCFESGPSRTETMNQEDALSYVRQIAEVGYLRGISITGGEPFIKLKLLKAVVREAGKHRLKSRVVSNCFWATSATHAKRILEPLQRDGLSELSVSSDAVHEEYVAKERVGFAARAALDMGMKVAISTVTLNSDLPDHVERTLQALSLPHHENLYVMPGFIVPGGQAIHSFGQHSFAAVDGDSSEGARLHVACPHVIREPVITPSGDLAACCSPSTATRTGFHASFVMGNLHERPLKELLDELENDVMFNMIMLEGPWSLYKLVKEHDPTAIHATKFVNICDLCVKVVANPKARKVLAEHLPEHALEMFAKKVTYEAHANGDVDDYIGGRSGVISMRPHK